MTDQNTFSRYITLGLLLALTITVWVIALNDQASLFA